MDLVKFTYNVLPHKHMSLFLIGLNIFLVPQLVAKI